MGAHSPTAPEKGPVRILCDEIGFRFDRRLERPDLLVAFVRELVAEVADMREMSARIAHLTGKSPSEASGEVLALAEHMLGAHGRSSLLSCAAAVHDASHRLNPDDAYPTDHLIDMLSSCASAVRFGLESPCASRHAAAAAQRVWKQIYGVGRFDSHTPAWENEWARAKLQDAITSLLPNVGGSGPTAVAPQVAQPIREDLESKGEA
jgi:hypothetical protein